MKAFGILLALAAALAVTVPVSAEKLSEGELIEKFQSILPPGFSKEMTRELVISLSQHGLDMLQGVLEQLSGDKTIEREKEKQRERLRLWRLRGNELSGQFRLSLGNGWSKGYIDIVEKDSVRWGYAFDDSTVIGVNGKIVHDHDELKEFDGLFVTVWGQQDSTANSFYPYRFIYITSKQLEKKP